ncbi:hypothetical protein CBM2585_A40402 [Cupriavidus taiwanensis]|nr:hypothetical protein CBM2585_A40402 [Cupriavidus taiwanensis]
MRKIKAMAYRRILTPPHASYQ